MSVRSQHANDAGGNQRRSSNQGAQRHAQAPTQQSNDPRAYHQPDDAKYFGNISGNENKMLNATREEIRLMEEGREYFSNTFGDMDNKL